MGALIGKSGTLKAQILKQSVRLSIPFGCCQDTSHPLHLLTNDTLAGGQRGPLSLNVVGFHLDLMPLGSSIEGNQKGLFRNPKFIDVRCPALQRYGRISIQCVLDIVTLDTVTAQSP